MKREELKKLGLNDEQVEAVIASHGQTVQSLNSQVDTLQQSEKELKNQLSSRDEDLAKLQKDNEDNEVLKTQIDTLKTQYEDLEKTSAEKLTKIQRDSALNTLLSDAKVKNHKAVIALLDDEKITFEDGKLSGVKEQIEALQKNESYLFQSDEPNEPAKKKQFVAGGNAGSGQPPKEKSWKDNLAENIAKTKNE